MKGESIEPKIQMVRQYIYDKKGVDIKNIIVKTHDDLMKLNHCYNVAKDFYFKQMGFV